MLYLWTEDTGAGFHYWQLANKYLFHSELVVESKGSNQGILDAVRALEPEKNDMYYIAFDLVYDNMDIVNKYQELRENVKRYQEQIIICEKIFYRH